MRGFLILSLLVFMSCTSSQDEGNRKVSSRDDYAKMISPTEEEGVFEFNASDVDDLYKEKDVIVSSDSIMDDEVKTNESDDRAKFYLYKIRKGDTALLVAFREYRNISMWENILAWNPQTEFKVGESIRLKYVNKDNLPKVLEVGTPYIVQKNDYLTRIADNVYNGKRDYWVSIWKNNRVLIKDKDLIYPGFIVYYKNFDLAKKESTHYYKQLAKMEEALSNTKLTSRD